MEEKQKPLFQKTKADWTSEYALVGKYVAEFEWLMDRLRFHCSVILQARGLKDWALGEILLTQKLFTAEPLVSVFESMSGELLGKIGDSDHLLKKVKDFRVAFTKKIAERNDLVHSTHMYGSNFVQISDDEKELEMHIIKRSPNKEGANVKEIAKGSKELSKSIEELQNLIKVFGELSTEIIMFLIEKDKYENLKITKG